MILEMVGHRDPNLVPLAAFYGDPDLRVNFCGKLASDPHPQVRRVRVCALPRLGRRVAGTPPMAGACGVQVVVGRRHALASLL